MWIFNIYTLMDPSLKQMRINTPGYGKKQPKNPDTVSLVRPPHSLRKSMRNFHVQVWNFVSIVSTHQSIWRKLLNSMQKSGRLMKQCLFMAGDIVKLHNNVIMRNSKSMLLSWKNTWKNQNLWRRSQQLLENRSFNHFYANQDRLHGKWPVASSL